MKRMKGQSIAGAALVIVFVSLAFLYAIYVKQLATAELPKFSSCNEMAAAFAAAQQGNGGAYRDAAGGIAPMASSQKTSSNAEMGTTGGGAGYSTTNVQVGGVDEADIAKTDGEYIYAISSSSYYGNGGSRLAIAKAYPAESAEIASITNFTNFTPSDMFIQGNRLLVFGYSYNEAPMPYGVKGTGAAEAGFAPSSMPALYPYYGVQMTQSQLWDISDKAAPRLVRTIEFEGSYLASRMIGSNAYVVVNSYPRYYPVYATEAAEGGVADGSAVSDNSTIIPLYRDSNSGSALVPTCGCADVSYFPPVDAESFITIASISMTDDNAEVRKEVTVGSGQNIYASQQNIYVADTQWNYQIMPLVGGEGSSESTEKIIVYKFSLDNGDINYKGSGEVPGQLLNQFSMDEFNGYFRVATTVQGVSEGQKSSSSVYVLDYNMSVAGRLEGIAPGESIYSARFMGNRAYLVTFKHVDPFFVIDLSNPASPQILGKLKIPGYSDYLHPYDENHIIGIGKDVDESIDADKIHSEDAVYYTAIKGVKLSLFDVSDVSNPVEISKYVIGDSGTESEATSDHKAFLFDKTKNLLVIPILLAEINQAKYPDGVPSDASGDYTLQGAYVFDLSLGDGFVLKGRVTHFDSDEAFKKSGYYFGGYGDSIVRSLYIDDTLYTISNNKIKANSLADLSELKTLAINKQTGPDYPILHRAM